MGNWGSKMHDFGRDVIDGAGLLFGKLLAMPGLFGVLAGALGFLFYWPTDKKEGATRILASAICSDCFGDALESTIVHFMPWIQGHQIHTGAMLMAGLPGWFILHAVFTYFKKNQDKDILEVTEDVRQAIKDK